MSSKFIVSNHVYIYISIVECDIFGSIHKYVYEYIYVCEYVIMCIYIYIKCMFVYMCHCV